MCPPTDPPLRTAPAPRLRRPPRGRPRAFTLVELLVSLALLGLVMSLIYAAFGQISGPALALRDELTERQDLRLLVRIISDDLQSAQWLTGIAQKGTQYRTGLIGATEVLEGKEMSRVAMHTVGPARFHRAFDPARDPRVHEVGYHVRLSEDRSTLELVRREDFYVDEEMERDGVEVVLTDRVVSFLVEYLPQPTQGATGLETWERRWDAADRPDASRMPLAVRVTLTRLGAQGAEHTESLEFNLPGSLKL